MWAESLSASTVSTWAKVRFRTHHRTPVHASSSYASGSAMQIGRTAAKTSGGTSAYSVTAPSVEATP